MSLYLYDDARARAFEPFALTRPAGELRVGALLSRERWALVAGVEATGSVAAEHLADYHEPWAPPVAKGTLPAGSLLANARCAPALTARIGKAPVVRVAGRVAAVRLGRDLTPDELRDGALDLEALARDADASAEIEGRWIDEVWELVASLTELVPADVRALAAARGVVAVRPEGCALLHEDEARGHAVYLEDGATVEPFVTFDLSAGPVYLERGATIQSFTRVAGPCYLGRDSVVSSDRVSAIVVGEACKVHGEISNTVFLGHSNKGHDGFVGHSYLGRWVNLGADTVTSNLKNTYGPVELWTPCGIRDTGQQFLGTLFGDHAKTGIGLTLTTGSVIGAGAQVYGSHMPPKVVPPFAWGDGAPYGDYRFDKFLDVASRVMARRHVELDDRGRRYLAAVRAARWSTED